MTTTTTTTQLFKYTNIICAFTRAQAIQDGYQMKLEDEMAAMASKLYKYPVYLTIGVVDLIEQAIASKKHCNDWQGVLWDILWMSLNANQVINEQTRRFTVKITGTRIGYDNFTMLIQCGPTDIDDPAPAMTIMLPEQE